MTQVHLPARISRERVIERLSAVLRALPMDAAYVVEVKDYKPRRSDAQNRFLWGVCYAELVKHLPGWTAEDVHEYMLGEHYGWERVEGLGRTRLKPIRRSSKLSKLEFMDFVLFVQQKAAEHGVYIPDPDPEAVAA